MRFLAIAFAALLVGISASETKAQQQVRICVFQSPQAQCIPVSNSNPLPVSASVSASITGFRPVSAGTPISVTASAGGVTGTLPTNTGEVIATNVGTTNGAYCALGASATTSAQYIAPNGGWFAFGISGDTQLTCITSTSTTTVNMVGGSGLPTGTGGGGGGGSGGAVTLASTAVASGAYSSGSIASGAFASGSIGSGAIASGAVASGAIASGALAAGAGTDGWDSTQGAKGDSVCGSATGTCSIAALIKFLNSQVIAPIPAGTNLIGKVGIDQTTNGTTNGVVSAANFYQAVAASATATVLQTATGATGDYLSHCILYPATTSPGVATVFDNTNTAANNAIAFPGGSSSTSNLVPIVIAVGAKSVNGAWKVTTGTNISVVCVGKFS